MQVAPEEVRTYIAFEVKKLLDFRSFGIVLPVTFFRMRPIKPGSPTLIGTLEQSSAL